MKLIETVVVMTITVSTVGVAWTQLDADKMSARSTIAAARATCHTVEAAIAAYLAEQGVLPTTVTDIRPYVRGDLTAYRIDQGRPIGPGCAVPPA